MSHPEDLFYLTIDRRTGLLQQAGQLASPHCDARPDPQDISGIVVHSISLPPGEFGGRWIDDLFLGRLDCSAHPYFEQLDGLRVSAHLLIRRDGSMTQYVPFHQRAWHAGPSCWDGRERCNDFTVGIELEGCDDSAFEAVQYRALAAVIDALCATYPQLDRQRVTGHADIAPDRKTDPGPCFDWARLHSLLT